MTTDIELIRMAWGSSVEAFGRNASGVIVTREYRFIPATQSTKNPLFGQLAGKPGLEAIQHDDHGFKMIDGTLKVGLCR